MDKKDGQKVKKYWRNNFVLAVGVISSLGFFSFVAKEGWQTFKRDPAPENIVILEKNIEPLLILEAPQDLSDLNLEIQTLLKNLKSPEYSIEEKQIIIKTLEEKLKKSNFGVSRHLAWNISHLLQVEKALSKSNISGHDLVLIGKKGWRYEPIFQAIAESPYQQNIHHLDYLSDDLVALFYTLAEVFVYPSHYEGFGLPVLEAMNLGTPVIASSSSSLPEVIGDAGLLINPDEPMELAEAILQVISNSQLQQDLIVKGRQRATNFSWEKTAQETLIAYSKIIP